MLCFYFLSLIRMIIKKVNKTQVLFSFFIFDFLLNLNKIAIFYIESGEKGGNSNISVL